MSRPYREEANLAVLRCVGRGQRVLDIGCGRGRLGAEVRALGNTVHGIELDADSAAIAATRLDLVHCGDARDRAHLPEGIREGKYDLVLLCDVLEHLAQPEELLRAVRGYLREGGRVIVSLPNVAAWPIRLQLAAGRFTYADSGILDRTHLRFFTRTTARALVRKADYDIVAEGVTPYLARALLGLVGRLRAEDGPAGLVDSRAYRVYARWIEPVEARLARLWPGMLAFQNVLLARARPEPASLGEKRIVVAMISRNEATAVAGVLREIREAAPEAQVLLVDSSTDGTAELAEQHGAVVVRQNPPRGYGPAMAAALQEAARRADVVVTMDCDGTYPASAIRPLAALVVERGWDLVNATRLARRPDAMPWANWVANTVFAWTTRLVHGLQTTDVHSGMRAYRASMLRDLTFGEVGAALPVELLVKPARLGYRVTEVAIDYRERIGTTTLRRLESTLWTFRRIFAQLRTGRRVRTGPRQ